MKLKQWPFGVATVVCLAMAALYKMAGLDASAYIVGLIICLAFTYAIKEDK